MVVHRTPTPIMYRVVAGILRTGMRAVARYEVTGIEHVPTQGGFLLTPNHVSHVDPFPWAHVLYNHGHSPVFPAKGSLFETPVVGWVLRHAKQVRVDRETDRAREALPHAARALAAGSASSSTQRARSRATPTCGRCGARPAQPAQPCRPGRQ